MHFEMKERVAAEVARLLQSRTLLFLWQLKSNTLYGNKQNKIRHNNC